MMCQAIRLCIALSPCKAVQGLLSSGNALEMLWLEGIRTWIYYRTSTTKAYSLAGRYAPSGLLYDSNASMPKATVAGGPGLAAVEHSSLLLACLRTSPICQSYSTVLPASGHAAPEAVVTCRRQPPCSGSQRIREVTVQSLTGSSRRWLKTARAAPFLAVPLRR